LRIFYIFRRTLIGILEDTLIGFQLTSYQKTSKRKAIKRSKCGYLVVSRDPVASTQGGIELMPWQDFLRRLWDGSII
jgi:hypothetical protein